MIYHCRVNDTIRAGLKYQASALSKLARPWKNKFGELALECRPPEVMGGLV